MYCDQCGTSLPPAARFCSTCGKSFAPVPQMPRIPANRVASHLRNLGIIWIVYSIIHLLPGLIVGSMPHWMPFDDHVFFFRGLFGVIGGFLMVKGVIGIIAGWGLLDRQPWARILAIVLGFFSLIHFPFGTAIGIYTLWVLLPSNSDIEYRQLARS